MLIDGYESIDAGLLARVRAVLGGGNALDAWATRASSTPWRVVVVGRVGVGKSTWVCRAVGAGVAAVGWGGVTQAACAYPIVDSGLNIEVFDTPGLDLPGADVSVTRDLASGADRVVWLVDALMPVGEAERRALAGIAADVEVFVARLDLVDGTERAEVVARARALTAPARFLGGGDVRIAAVERPSPGRSVVRDRGLLDAIDATLRAVGALPPPQTEAERRAAVRGAWRRALGEVEELLAAEVDRGDWRDPSWVDLRMSRLAPMVDERVLRGWPEALPPPPQVAPPPVGDRASLPWSAGVAASRRAVRSAVARWAAEVDVALEEASATWPPPTEHAARAALEAELAALSAALQSKK